MWKFSALSISTAFNNISSNETIDHYALTRILNYGMYMYVMYIVAHTHMYIGQCACKKLELPYHVLLILFMKVVF